MPAPYRVLITGSREYGGDLFVAPTSRVLRAGWRALPSTQRDAMRDALRGVRARAGHRPLTIVHGAARGADLLAAALAENAGCATESWPALWRREDGSVRGGYDRAEALRMQSVYRPGAGYYRQAGPERNRAMVASSPDEVLAFRAVGAGNRGTDDCIRVAQAARLTVTITQA